MKETISSKSRFLTGLAILFTLLSISNSCTKKAMYDMTDNTGSKGGSGGPGKNEIWIQGMVFKPSVLSVAKDSVITWTNKDAVPHTVTSDAGLFDSGSINSGGTFSYKFSSIGTFPYHCAMHPLMTAKVIVSAAPPESTTVSIENMAFVPSDITVSAGTTVVWTNNDGVAHTVTSDTGLFDSGSLGAAGVYSSGGSFNYTFNTAGTYLYHCTFHPAMTGKVIVN